MSGEGSLTENRTQSRTAQGTTAKGTAQAEATRSRVVWAKWIGIAGGAVATISFLYGIFFVGLPNLCQRHR